MSIQKKKFKKLRKELQYWQSELEYVQEVLVEWHANFEEYYREYCKTMKINIHELEQQNSKKVKETLPLGYGLVPESGSNIFEDKTDEKEFKKIYKKLAKKIHPDIGGDENDFKKVTEALSEKNFEKLLDMCDKHDISIDVDDKINEVVLKQIQLTKTKINNEKSTYSWLLYSCEGDKRCKNNVVKKFLEHLFNYTVKVF